MTSQSRRAGVSAERVAAVLAEHHAAVSPDDGRSQVRWFYWTCTCGQRSGLYISDRLASAAADAHVAAAVAAALDDGLRERVEALHKPVAADERCEAETWSGDHYGDNFDLYWIRCTRHGEHDEHSDSGNTGCTWALTDADRADQARLPRVCDECDQSYPCPTIAALAAQPTAEGEGQ